MSREKNCPKCEADITESYEGYDPSVGIMSAGWYCEACQEPVEDDPQDHDFEERD